MLDVGSSFGSVVEKLIHINLYDASNEHFVFRPNETTAYTI